MTPIPISHFSDVSCVWAYIAQIRVAENRTHVRESNKSVLDGRQMWVGLVLKRVFGILVLIYSTMVPSLVIAQEEVQELDGSYVAELRPKFILGLAAGYFLFDTSFNYINETTGRNLFIDAEGTLGLPETELTPMIYGVYRPSKRHGFGYFGIRRETNLLAIDENLGDINVTGDVFLSDRTRFLTLAYNLT